MFFNISNKICPSNHIPYTISQGDTLFKLSNLYKVSIESIIDANPGLNPNFLVIGQKICIPILKQFYPSCATTNYYVVTPLDTFSSIAKYFGITPVELLYSNLGIMPQSLFPGQILCIPVAPSPVELQISNQEMKLFLYFRNSRSKSYNIISMHLPSNFPYGQYTVINKDVEPEEIYGERKIGLSYPGLSICGSNLSKTPNLLSESGLIRISNNDIIELFNFVPVGTMILLNN